MISYLKKMFSRQTKSNQSTGQRIVYVPMSKGGVYVDHDTALKFSAVFACVRYVAETVAGLPWHIYKRLPNGGKDIALTHPLERLIHLRPNPDMSAFAFKTVMTAWAQTWGNGYAEIEKDASGRIAALWPISPDRVEIKRDPDSGALFYEINNQRGPKTILKPNQVFHLAGMGFDGIRGYSIISLAATSIGAGIASDDFVSSFYANGAVLSGALTHPKSLTDEAHARLKEDFAKQFGGAQKAWKPIILEEDMKWQTFGMPLKDAEFIASQKYRVNDIARWFRVPPHKIADLERATFTNIEHQSIEVVQDTIMPWTIRFEQEADYKLISARNHAVFYTKLNLNSMMRGDHENRSKFYKAMREMGSMSVNDIRLLEDLNPIGPDGDKYVMQSQYTTLEKIGEDIEPPPIPKPEPDPDDPDLEKAKSLYGKIITDISRRILRREKNRFEDAKKRVETVEAFNTWLDGFYEEHKKYMHKAYTSSVEAISEHHNYDQNTTNAILNLFVDRRITLNKQILIDSYSGKDSLWDEKERAAAMTDQLLEEISNLATKG